MVFRDAPADARLLHAEAAGLARHDALIRVPGEGPPALLALLARDRHMLDPAQGSWARSASSAAPWPPHSAADAVTGEEARQCLPRMARAGASRRRR